MHHPRFALLGLLLFLTATCTGLAADSPIGFDFLRTGAFEAMGKDNAPEGWVFAAEPPAAGQCSLDSVNAFAGRTSVKLSSKSKGAMWLRTLPIPIPQDKGGCLLTFASQTQSFQADNRAYSGISCSIGLQFLDAQGKGVAPSDDLGVGYVDKKWNTTFQLISPFPKNATQVMVIATLANDSEKVTGRFLPATLWLDSVQLLGFTPPVGGSPKVLQDVQFGKGALLQSHVGKVIADALASGGSAATGLTPGTQGTLLDAPTYPSAGPGIYRAVLRWKVADTSKATSAGLLCLGPMDGAYAIYRSLMPNMVSGGSYSDLPIYFLLTSDAKWTFHLDLTGTQAVWIDKLTVEKVVSVKLSMPGSSRSESGGKGQ